MERVALGMSGTFMLNTSSRLAAALLAGSALAAPAAAEQLYGSEIVQQATIRFYSLDGSDASGWQLVAPLTYVGAYQVSPAFDLDLHVKSAWVTAEADRFGSSFDYSGLSDTVVGATFTGTGYAGWQPFFTIDLNLPTGTSGLTFDESVTLADPDLVDLARYGEGFNANISAGASFFLDPNWTLTAGLGFNARGSYEPFAGSSQELDPGDQLTALLRVQYLSETRYASLQLRYRDESVTQLGSNDFVEPGARLELKGEAAFQLDEISTLSLLASASWWGKNAYYDFFADAAVEEAANSNGAVYYGEITYQRDLGAVDLRTFVSIKRRTSNDYDTLDFQFRPQRTIWRVGASIDYALTPATALTLGATAGQVIDDAQIFQPGDLVFANWSITAGASFSF